MAKEVMTDHCFKLWYHLYSHSHSLICCHLVQCSLNMNRLHNCKIRTFVLLFSCLEWAYPILSEWLTPVPPSNHYSNVLSLSFLTISPLLSDGALYPVLPVFHSTLRFEDCMFLILSQINELPKSLFVYYYIHSAQNNALHITLCYKNKDWGWLRGTGVTHFRRSWIHMIDCEFSFLVNLAHARHTWSCLAGKIATSDPVESTYLSFHPFLRLMK